MNSNRSNLVLSENDIQNAILEFLRFKKIPGIRVNNGAVYDKKKESFRRKNKWEVWMGAIVDIKVFLPDGKDCWIEVKKNEFEKPSAEQIKFMDNVNKRGGIAFVAYSVACVKKKLCDYL